MISYSDTYTLVHKYPGIDTPLLCLYLNDADMVDPDIRGAKLASWLNEWHKDAWHETCEAIDQLIIEGKVAFMDDGQIYPAGYTGEIFVNNAPDGV